jgi:hypothetical protein
MVEMLLVLKVGLLGSVAVAGNCFLWIYFSEWLRQHNAWQLPLIIWMVTFALTLSTIMPRAGVRRLLERRVVSAIIAIALATNTVEGALVQQIPQLLLLIVASLIALRLTPKEC